MVNVIIPVYNSSEVLRDALRSLENQTNKMFWITVVDDCSTEDIQAVCEEFKTLHLTYLKTEVNSGPGIARQLGLDKAIQNNFEYVMFLDADDILYPRAIEILQREISRNFCDFITTPIQVEKKNNPGFVIDTNQATTWLHGKMYRTAFLKEHNIKFSRKTKYNEDSAFNLLVYNYSNNKCYIEEIVYLWRDYNNSITRNTQNIDFINKCYPDYIIGICESLQILINNNSLYNTMGQLCVLYNNYQLLKNDNKEYDTTHIDIILYNLLSNNDIFNKILLQPESKFILFNQINSCDFINKQLIFYKESFYEWYKRFCKNWKEVFNENYIN